MRAFAEAALVGLTGALLGVWIVLFGLAYEAESLPHAMFPGLVVAALVGGSVVVGGLVGLVVAAFLIVAVRRISGAEADTATAVVVTGLFGAGALLALAQASPPGLEAMLFGDILSVSNFDVLLSACAAVGVAATLALLHGRFMAVGFDRQAARGTGIDPRSCDLVAAALLVVTVAVSVQALGNLLVPAALIAPPAAALRLCDSVGRTMALGSAIAVSCAAGGLYVSYYVNVAAGASVAGVFVVSYVAASALARFRGRAPGSRRLGSVEA